LKTSTKPDKSLDLTANSAGPAAWEDSPVTIRTAVGKADAVYLGTKNSNIYCWNTKRGDLFPLLNGHFEEFWGLAAHPKESVYATGGTDQIVRVWNVAEKCMISAKNVKQKVWTLHYSPDAKYLAVGTESGDVLILNGTTLELERTLSHGEKKDFKVTVVKFSTDGNFLAAGTAEKIIDVYFIENDWKKIGTCKGHSAHITHLDWSADSKVLQTDSGALEHLFWDVENIKQLTKSTIIRDLKWTSWSCILGWTVKGIWPKGADGTDINAVNVSNSEHLVATADDFGTVKLFRCPVDIGAECHEYSGHSAHVSCVRWTINDTHLISTGGNDRTIFQWKLIGGKGELVLPEGAPRIFRVASPTPSDDGKSESSPSSPTTPSKPRTSSPATTPIKGTPEEKSIHELVDKGLLTDEKAKALIDVLQKRDKVLSLLSKLKKTPKSAPEIAKDLGALV